MAFKIFRRSSRPHHDPTPSGKRLNGRIKKQPVASSAVRVIGYLDQHNEKWLRIGFRKRWALGRLSDLIAAPTTFYAQLAKSDVTILNTGLRGEVTSQAQDAAFEKKAYVVDRFGWHGRSYIWPGSTLPKQIHGIRTIDGLAEGHASWSTAGSFPEWKAGVQRLANGQALPTFVLGCAFAALIQPFVPEIEGNPGFELCGRTSIGKSKLMRLAASVFGSKKALLRTWNTTVNALEPAMAAAGDGLLLLDELNLFLDSVPDSHRTLGNAIHKLSQGSEKDRLPNPTTQTHRFLFLSSSNQPITEVVKGIGQDRVAAIAVRMPTIPADAGTGHGVFDTLPVGCSSSAEAVRQINLLAKEHYGWAARAFIDKLEYRLGSRHRQKRLLATLNRSVTEFKRHARISGDEGEINRVADLFAPAFLALRLARRWQILPLSGIGDCILTVYRRYLARLPQQSNPEVDSGPIDRVRNYVTRHRSELHQLDGADYPDITDQQLDQVAGFLRNTGGATYLIIRAARWSAEFGLQARSLLDDLLTQQRLKATDGYRCQIKVRRSKPKDGVYCIRID